MKKIKFVSVYDVNTLFKKELTGYSKYFYLSHLKWGINYYFKFNDFGEIIIYPNKDGAIEFYSKNDNIKFYTDLNLIIKNDK